MLSGFEEVVYSHCSKISEEMGFIVSSFPSLPALRHLVTLPRDSQDLESLQTCCRHMRVSILV